MTNSFRVEVEQAVKGIVLAAAECRAGTITFGQRDKKVAELVGIIVNAAHAANTLQPPAQPQVQGGWQDIATAPKDGRTLLLGYRNRLGNWRTVRGQWMSDEYIADYWEEPEGVEPGWFETADQAEDPPNCWRVDPTHWQHSPPPPEEKEPSE